MLTILQGDAVERLRELPSESVQCCVTSPPYWGLRDYGTAAWEGGDAGCSHEPPQEWIDHNFNANSAFGNGAATQSAAAKGRWFKADGSCRCGARRIDSQLGLERDPETYVNRMVEVFREVRRVLRKDGTLWLNLGDSYATPKEGNTQKNVNSLARREVLHEQVFRKELPPGLKPKDLCGIPWRVAFALQADGWWLRSDIIWAKPNPMPESVTDRPTKSHEYLFLLTKASTYYYDAEAIKEKAVEGLDLGILRSIKAANGQGPTDRASIDKRLATGIDIREGNPSGSRNKRSVWTVATAPYPEAHFATYPPDLIKPCIMAGTSAKGCCARCGAPWERVVGRECEPRYVAPSTLDRFGTGEAGVHRNIGGQYSKWMEENPMKTLGWQATCKCDADIQPCTVLDCFAGSGTTGAVALELGRKAVLIELNPKYVALIEQRCNVTMGLALA